MAYDDSSKFRDQPKPVYDHPPAPDPPPKLELSKSFKDSKIEPDIILIEKPEV